MTESPESVDVMEASSDQLTDVQNIKPVEEEKTVDEPVEQSSNDESVKIVEEEKDNTDASKLIESDNSNHPTVEQIDNVDDINNANNSDETNVANNNNLSEPDNSNQSKVEQVHDIDNNNNSDVTSDNVTESVEIVEPSDNSTETLIPSVDTELESSPSPALVSVHHSILRELQAAVSESLPPSEITAEASPVEQEEQISHTPRITALTFITPVESKQQTPRTPKVIENNNNTELTVNNNENEQLSLTNDTGFSLPLDPEYFSVSSEPLLYLKITSTLSSLSCSHSLKSQALQVAIDLSRQSKNIYYLIDHGVYDEAVINAGEGNENVRILSTQLLIIIISSHHGRQHANSFNLLTRCPQWVIDQIPEVRSNTCLIINQLTMQSNSNISQLFKQPQSTAATNFPSLLAFLIHRLTIDSDYLTKSNLLIILLRAIKIKEGRIICRYQKLFSVLKKCFITINENNPSSSHGSRNNNFSLLKIKNLLISNLCLIIAELVLDPIDKKDFTLEKLYSYIIPLIINNDATIRKTSLLSLMNATIHLNIKLICIKEFHLLSVCIKQIQQENEIICLSLIFQLLCNLCEHPEARQYENGIIYSEEIIQMIQNRMKEKNHLNEKNLQFSAKALLEKLQFQP